MFSSPSRPPSPTAWAQNSQINDDSSILPDMWPLMTLAPGNVIQNRLIINRTAEMEKHWFWHQLILHRLHRHCIQNCVFVFSDTSVLKKCQEKKNIHQEMYSVLLYRMKSNIYKQLLKWDSEGGGNAKIRCSPPPPLSGRYNNFTFSSWEICSHVPRKIYWILVDCPSDDSFFPLCHLFFCVLFIFLLVLLQTVFYQSLRHNRRLCHKQIDQLKPLSEARSQEVVGRKIGQEWVPVCLRNKTSLPAHLLIEHVIRKRGSRGGEKKETPQNTFGKVELVKNTLFTWCSITTNKFFFLFLLGHDVNSESSIFKSPGMFP